MTKSTVEMLADNYGFDLSRDFHTLRAEEVGRVIHAADTVRYRQSKRANGSRARTFWEYMQRVDRKED